MHLGKILEYRLSKQILRRMTCGYLLTDIAGGDVHHGDIDQVDMGVRSEIVSFTVWTRIDI